MILQNKKYTFENSTITVRRYGDVIHVIFNFSNTNIPVGGNLDLINVISNGIPAPESGVYTYYVNGQYAYEYGALANGYIRVYNRSNAVLTGGYGNIVYIAKK